MDSLAGWNPNYVAYARAHGLEPAAMAARDHVEAPGGCMGPFIRWISQQKQAFAKAHPGAMNGHNIGDYEAWQSFLQQQAQTAALALRAAPLIEYDVPGEGLLSLAMIEPATAGSSPSVVE